MKYFGVLLIAVMHIGCTAQKTTLLVGTYDKGQSSGVYVYDFNKKTGATSLSSNTPLPNASFLAVAPNKKTVYAVSEIKDSVTKKGGKVAALSFDKSNQSLTLLNMMSTEGSNPCHITTDNTGKYVLAANYSSGNFVLLDTKEDGSLNSLKQNIQHEGKGKDASRQESPHAHGVFFNTDFTQLYVTDLGIDKTMSYNFTNGVLAASDVPSIDEKPGAGPRHLAVHPTGKYLYVLNELNAMISTYFPYNGTWKFIASTHTEPDFYTGKSSAAAIIISKDGKFLYTTNRGTANSIAIFAIDPKSGALGLVGQQPSLGIKPRNINIDPSGNFLLAAHQDSDDIIVFKRDTKTGLLENTNQTIRVAKPVCVEWIND